MPINYLKKIQLGEFCTEAYRISPEKDIQSVIEGFYVFAKDPNDNSQLIFNDGFPVLVFLQNVTDKITVKQKNQELVINAAWASAGSIKNVYVNYNQPTNQLFIVRFHPGAFYQLFGLTMEHFKQNPVSSFERIAENNLFGLSDLFKCKSGEEKAAFVGKYVKRAVGASKTPKIIKDTLDHIHKTKGQVTVHDAMANVCVNYKRLERNFAQHVGLLPRDYIQLQRFMHAYLELVKSKKADLTQIAVANGYYDANHFLKAFKLYTGKTPMAYIKFQASS